MDFKLNEDQELMRDMFQEFVEINVKDIAAELDEEERFPDELINEMAEVGLFGVTIPEEYDGVGADNLTCAIAIEEISKSCASTGITLAAHLSLCVQPILKYGTKEQKEKYLPALATGEKLGAFALTEPGAGTDASNQRTVVKDLGDYYELNGNKIFITNGEKAEVYVVFARTEKESSKETMSAFLVEKGTPGFSFGSHERKMGIRGSSTCELIFEKVKLPKENLLGEWNKGFEVAMDAIDAGRVAVAAQALGIAEGSFESAVEYVKTREQFDKPISYFQNTKFMLAEMKTRIEATRHLVYSAAVAQDNGEDFKEKASIAKLYASETAREVTWRAVQLYGGYGYTRDYPVERMMRDSKITEIYAGTSEVQKMIIGDCILGN